MNLPPLTAWQGLTAPNLEYKGQARRPDLPRVSKMDVLCVLGGSIPMLSCLNCLFAWADCVSC